MGKGISKKAKSEILLKGGPSPSFFVHIFVELNIKIGSSFFLKGVKAVGRNIINKIRAVCGIAAVYTGLILFAQHIYLWGAFLTVFGIFVKGKESC